MTPTTNLKKLNNLVTKVFSEYVDNVEELWNNNTEVQKNVKSLLSSNQKSNKKDPNAPKRNKTNYLFFCEHNREKVKKDRERHGDSSGDIESTKEITKELAKRWRELNASKKSSDKKELSKYNEMAKQDKERYEKQKSEYVPPVDSEKPKLRGGKKKAKGGPKGPKNAYLFFYQEMTPEIKRENPDLKASQIASKIGKMWNDLKNDSSRSSEHQRYVDMYESDKLRYEKEKLGQEEPVVEHHDPVVEVVEEKTLKDFGFKQEDDEQEVIEESPKRTPRKRSQSSRSRVKK